VVVDAESKKTNKITLRSEWRGVRKSVQRKRKKLWKERKKDLTEPVLLEMDDYCSPDSVFFKTLKPFMYPFTRIEQLEDVTIAKETFVYEV
jgi:hypothetical protein